MGKCLRPLSMGQINDKIVILPYGQSKNRTHDIACGQCIECRLAKARSWGQRADKEAALSTKKSWFITLTYEDKFLKKGKKIINTITGEITQNATLDKKHIQLWMKRIRKKYGEGIKYMICGEYGPSTNRPHYHGIIIGLNPKDIKPIKNTNYLQSEELNKTWNKGFITIAKYQYETANYTAGYIMKKQTGKQKYKDKEQEFMLTSRNPGLGKKWFDLNYKSIYETDKVNIKTNKGVIQQQPNKYYDYLLKKIDENKYNEIKKTRMLNAQNKIENKPNKNKFELDIDREYEAIQKTKGQRNKI